MHTSQHLLASFVAAILVAVSVAAARADEPGVSGFADSGGVKIHYREMGKGPLLILIHGFPDFWYSWRGQMPELAKSFRVVAIDQRGYNLSDKPEGVDNYKVEKL